MFFHTDLNSFSKYVSKCTVTPSAARALRGQNPGQILENPCMGLSSPLQQCEARVSLGKHRCPLKAHLYPSLLFAAFQEISTCNSLTPSVIKASYRPDAGIPSARPVNVQLNIFWWELPFYIKTPQPLATTDSCEPILLVLIYFKSCTWVIREFEDSRRWQGMLLKFPEGMRCGRLSTLPLWGCLSLSSVFYAQHKMKWNRRAPQAVCVNSVHHCRGKAGYKEQPFLMATPAVMHTHRKAFAGKVGGKASPSEF